MKWKKRFERLENSLAFVVHGAAGQPGPPGPMGPSGPATEKALVNELLTRVAALESMSGAALRRLDAFERRLVDVELGRGKKGGGGHGV